MRRVRFQPQAKRDLQDILRYIVRESATWIVARRFVDLIQDQCRELASLPGTLGRSRDDLGPGLRSTVVRNYVVLFRYETGVMRIVRIVEGHRDFPTLFNPD